MPQAIGVNLVIMETSGKTGSTGIWIPSSTTLANAINAAKAFALLVEPAIEGAITLASITLPVSLVGVTTRPAPIDGSSLSEGIMFGYRTGSNFKTSFRLPTINEGAFLPDRSVDLADANILAINNAMVGGLDLTGVGGTGTVNPANISDEDITARRFTKEAYKGTSR